MQGTASEKSLLLSSLEVLAGYALHQRNMSFWLSNISRKGMHERKLGPTYIALFKSIGLSSWLSISGQFKPTSIVTKLMGMRIDCHKPGEHVRLRMLIATSKTFNAFACLWQASFLLALEQ